MMNSPRAALRTAGVAVRAMAILTLVLGVAYPLVITGIGQIALPSQANGSLVSVDGRPVGSALIGQPFTDADGAQLREYFQPRPSAAGDGYDASASSGSNLGPENPELIAAITERKAQIAAFNGVEPGEVPPDALTASSSGLDPHISPEYARLQVARVAGERDIPEAAVSKLVDGTIQERDLGFLGEPVVNVLKLNIALDELKR